MAVAHRRRRSRHLDGDGPAKAASDVRHDASFQLDVEEGRIVTAVRPSAPVQELYCPPFLTQVSQSKVRTMLEYRRYVREPKRLSLHFQY